MNRYSQVAKSRFFWGGQLMPHTIVQCYRYHSSYSDRAVCGKELNLLVSRVLWIGGIESKDTSVGSAL